MSEKLWVMKISFSQWNMFYNHESLMFYKILLQNSGYYYWKSNFFSYEIWITINFNIITFKIFFYLSFIR